MKIMRPQGQLLEQRRRSSHSGAEQPHSLVQCRLGPLDTVDLPIAPGTGPKWHPHPTI